MTVTRTQGAPRPQLIGDHVELGTQPGHDSPVLGLAVHGDRLFATHYHSTADPAHTSTEKGTLVVLDRVTLAEVAPRIEVGWQPRQVVVNPTSRHVYVFNYGADSKSITIVGLDSLQVEGEITPDTGWPVRMAVDPVADQLYVITYQANGPGEVIAFHGHDHSIAARLSVGDGLTDIDVDEANRLLYITRFHAAAPFLDELVIVDASMLHLPTQVSVSRVALPFRSRPQEVVHHPGLDRAFVRCEGVNGAAPPGVLEYDHAAHTQQHLGKQGGPVALDLDRFHERVHLLTNTALAGYDAVSLAPTSPQPEPIPGGLLQGLAVDPETSTVAVGDAAGRVTLVHPDLATGDAPHAGADAPMTIVGHDGQMELFVAANDDRLRMSRWTEGTDWDFGLGWVEAPDKVPAGTPLAGLSRVSGTWEVYAVRDDRQLWALSGGGDGTIGAWEPLGGQFPLRAHVTAISRFADHRTVFAVGDDGQVFSVGGTGAEVTSAPIEGAPPLTPGAPIAAVTRKDDHWDLFVLAADGQVWSTWWSADDGFAGWGSLGGTFPAGTPITAVTRHRNSLELFAVRDDGQVVTQFWHSEDGWSGWRAVRNDDNAAPVGAAVGAMCRDEDSIDIFVTRADQQIWTAGWGQGWAAWRPLGARVGRPGALVAAKPRPGTDQWMHICWVGDGGAVETAWWNRVQRNGGWSLDNGVRLRIVTESVRHDVEVVTDTDHLSGQVNTRLWRDGNYLVSGHVHDNGFDPYRFATHSAVLSEEGYSVANLGTGHVDGTGSDLSPDRDAYWNDVGLQLVIAGAYDELAAGAPVASCDSKNIGLGGGLSSIFHSVFDDFLDPLILDPTRTITQGAMAIGHELFELLHLPEFIPGPQSIFTYTGAVGWLSGYGYLVPVLPWYQEIGGLDPFVDHRELDEDEWAFVDQVFQGTLPPRERILLTDAVGAKKHPFSRSAKGREFVFPVSDDEDTPILVNIGEAFEHPTTHSDEDYPVAGQVLIHEMTHVWHVFNTHMSHYEWLRKGITDGNYDPPPAATPWSDFGIEQKAATVDKWFAAHIAQGLDTSAALHDPYFKFIHLVRTRVTGD
jgi:hypothetical protein